MHYVYTVTAKTHSWKLDITMPTTTPVNTDALRNVNTAHNPSTITRVQYYSIITCTAQYMRRTFIHNMHGILAT